MTFNESMRPQPNLLAKAMAGPLSRRALIKKSALLGVSAPFVVGLLGACGEEDDDVVADPGDEPDDEDVDPVDEPDDDVEEVDDEPGDDVEEVDDETDVDPEDPEPGEIVFVEGTDVTAFDPQFITDTPTNSMANLIYDSLTTYDDELWPIPQIASDWEVSEDGLTWTFHLEEGPTFSTGEELTAEDVKFTYDRYRAEETGSPHRSQFEIIEEVVAVDSTTVEFVTEAPFPDLIINVSNSGILSASHGEGHDEVDEYGQDPVGAGPFMLEEWVPGEFCSFVPNPNYWGEEPQVDRIIYRPVPESSTRAAMAQTGEADIVVQIAPPDFDSIEQADGVELVMFESMYQISFEMNVESEDPPLNNQLVRQALNYAVDKQAIIDSVLGGLGEVVVSPFGPGIQYRREFEPYTYDPDRAQELLEEAGYPDGFSMTLWSPDGRYLNDRQIAEAVQGYITAIGIDCGLQIWEWSPYLEAIRDPDEDRHAMMLGRATPGADYTATRLWSQGAHWQYNVTLFWDEEIEELLVEGRTNFDDDVREEAYGRILEIVWEQAPWLFLHNQPSPTAVGDDVEGLEMWQTEVYNLRRVSKS